MAVENRFCWRRIHRDNGVAGIGSANFRTQAPQTARRGFDIPIGFGTDELGRVVGKGCADQQPVGLGFRRNNGNLSPQRMGMNGNVHIKDLPG